MTGEPTVILNIRVPAEMHQQLTVEAKARGLSVTRLCRALLGEGLRALVPVGELKLTYDSLAEAEEECHV